VSFFVPDSESSTSVFRCQFRDGAVKVSDLPLEMLALAFCTWTFLNLAQWIQ